MKKIFLLSVALICCISVLSIQTDSWAQQKTLKIGFEMGPTHPFAKASEKLAELVSSKTKGNLVIKSFPASQLGNNREMMELLKVGTLEFQFAPTSGLASFVPEMDIFNFPMLFKDINHAKKFLAGPGGKKLLGAMEKANLKGLGFGEIVFRVPMNSKKPLNTLDDFKGLKIRTMQVPTHLEAYKAFGASPTPMAFGELYNGLQMGVIDGAENDPGTLYTEKFYEVQKYMSMIPIVINISVLIASKPAWDKLSSDYQKAILDSVPEAINVLNKTSEDLQGKAMEEMKKKGVIINTPRDMAPFFKAAEVVYEKYQSKLPPLAQELIKEIREESKK